MNQSSIELYFNYTFYNVVTLSVIKILLADNVALFHKIIGSALADVNVSFHAVNSLKQAKELLDEMHFDIVCCGLYLADADGLSLLRYFRSNPAYTHNPFLILTGENSFEIRQKALQEGATSIFCKSSELDDLITYLRRFVRQFDKMSGSVLLLEDSISQQKYIKEVLQDAGMEVDAVENVNDALELLDQKVYHLILTDIILQGEKTGLDMVSQVRRLKDARGDTPILAMTKADDAARRIELFRLGINDYLPKPFGAEELIVRVRHLISGSSFVKAQNEMLNNFLKFSVDPVCVVDKQGFVKNRNVLFKQLICHNVDGQNLTYVQELFQDEMQLAQLESCLATTSTGMLVLDVTLSTLNGMHSHQIYVQSFKEVDSNTQCYILMFRDRATDMGLSNQLEYLNQYDPLTNLKNRNCFNNELNKACDKKESFALILLDIHQFKFINSQYGQNSGDAILQMMASHLDEHWGKDALVFRTVADEFAMIVPSLQSYRELEERCFDIQEILTRPCLINKELIQIRVNIAAGVFPNQASQPDTITSLIMGALNLAKSHSKPKPVIIDDLIAAKIQNRNQIRFLLQQALSNDEFELNFQPLIDATTFTVMGCEVLIRWNSPVLGRVAPDEFLPIAETLGLLNDIGDWVIRTSVKYFKKWRKRYPELMLAINVSPSQLDSINFLESLARHVNIFRDEPNIDIEITEQVLMRDPKKVMYLIQSMQSMGLNISIDDFGTGFSSLAYLKQLSFNTIKIDKCFVNDLPHDKDTIAVVLSILDLAKHFSASVVAEGVETLEQANYLRDNGCNILQGYYFSKPIDAHAFENYLNNNYQKAVSSI